MVDGIKTAIDVCVCTYQRTSIEATLRSIAQQTAHLNGYIRVIVADNDATPSNETIVKEVSKDLGLTLTYIHAPERNISIARNACLDSVEAEIIAFIDDDEIANFRWLEYLLMGLEKSNADVVFGPVRAIYPTGTPSWIVKADLHSFQPVQFADGTIATGYTSNVLMRRNALGSLRFEERLGRSGGEDTYFFSSLYQSGANLVFEPHAEVTEIVAANRLSLSWLCQRSFRSGQTHAKILNRNGRSRITNIATAFCKACFCIVLAVFNFPIESRRNRAIVRGALHWGVVLSLLGKQDLELY